MHFLSNTNRTTRLTLRHEQSSTAGAMQRTRKNLERKKKEKVYLRELLLKYDTDFTGTFSPSELKKILRDVDSTFDVTDEVVNMVIERTKAMTTGKASERSNGEESILLEELLDAIWVFSSYMKQAHKIDALFREYDTDNTGKLEYEEIRQLMTDINNGVAPTNEQIDMVLEHVGVKNESALGVNDVKPAVAVWMDIVHSSKPSSSTCDIL